MLSLKAAPRAVDDELRTIGARLLDAARASQAYGLAAAHIGEVAPVIVVSTAPPERRDYRVFYNPMIAAQAEDTVTGTEGSVSLPGVEVELKRPGWVELAFDNETGQRQRERFDGFVARCVMHETEQVDGVFFLDRLSRLKRTMLLKKLQK
ncbi:MAG: Peptide deformylase [Devosia sp.]|nr:Peptide deformylase [Devosia sp.]